jgi:hypothetical protein
VIVLRAGKLEREARDRDGLAASLAHYSPALDRLEMEIAGLPPQPGRVGAASQRLARA